MDTAAAGAMDAAAAEAMDATAELVQQISHGDLLASVPVSIQRLVSLEVPSGILAAQLFFE